MLTPEATTPVVARWTKKEVDWHFSERRSARILTIFFPPNAPENCPKDLGRLTEYKSVQELPGAEVEGSVSIRVLMAIAGRESPATAVASWLRLQAGAGRAYAQHPFHEVRKTFTAVRQRTRMKQSAVAAAFLLCIASASWWWTSAVTRQRLALAPAADHAEADQRFLEAERLWLAAAQLAPWGQQEFREKASQARQRRLLSPATLVTLPAGWRARAIGSKGDGWCLFAHRLHDDGMANGQAALIDSNGWLAIIPTGDDFNPRVFFHSDIAYVEAAGKVIRIPLTGPSGIAPTEIDLGLRSYRLASFAPQIELGWKDVRVCVLAGLELPPRVLLLDPTTLRLRYQLNLALPITLPNPQNEPDGSDRYGEAVFRLSTREDRLAVAVWQRYTQHKVGVISWGLDFQSRAGSRMFDLNATEIGPLAIPKLEHVECSPGDQQLFLRISTISLSGDPRYSGQTFWLALDTASNRPPFLMERMVSEVWPLPSQRRLEAYYRVDGGDLRALTFPDFVVTTRPALGVLHEIRAAALLPIPLLPIPGSAEPILAAASSGEIALVQAAQPVFRLAVSQGNPHRPERVDHVYADPAGHWLAAIFEIDADTTPRRLLVCKAGAPLPFTGAPDPEIRNLELPNPTSTP